MHRLSYKNLLQQKSLSIHAEASLLMESNSSSLKNHQIMNEQSDIFEIFLHAGEYVIASEPCIVRTILGSCVAITLWHPVKKIGTMSHCLLPQDDSRSSKKISHDPSGKYCDEVVGLMLRALEQANVNPAECQAKIFGGSSTYPQNLPLESDGIGKKNGDMARRLLSENGISVVSESLYGIGHRMIAFDLSSGDVWVRRGGFNGLQSQ
jgi:chemotaxis protein CheD